MSQPTEDRLRQVEERLRWVEERLAYLEARQAGPPPLPRGPSIQPRSGTGSVDASTASAMAVEKLDDFTEADWQRSLTPVADDIAPTPPIAAEPIQPLDVAGSLPPVVTPVMAYQPGPQQYRPQDALRQPGDLERTIGLKWAGWFGAIVLVIGAGLAIKFAYDQGWLGRLPDVVKLMLMSLGGFGLIAAGEVVLRRVNRLSAVGLYGAGVAVLFLVGYAGYEWYDVYAQGTAFALMGAATLIGVLIAARADLVSIAVLSLVGGHIVPILLGEKSSSAVPLLSYLLLLQTLALSLCFLQATPKWWVLRSVSLAATSLWQLALVVARADGPTDTVAASSVFMAIYWTLYQAELVLTTLRVERQQSDRQGLPSIVPGGLVFSIVVTALTILILLAAHDEATAGARGGIVLAAAGICAATGFSLWLSRRESLAGLSGSLRAQAAALLVLAVPVGLDAENVVFGMLALAIGFGLLAVARKLRISAIASIATWLLAIYALFWWVATSAAAQSPWLTLGGVAISAAVVVAAATCLIGHGVAVMFGVILRDWLPKLPPVAIDIGKSAPPPSAQSIEIAVHAVAAVVWAVAAITGLSGLPATIALLAYAWFMCGVSFWPAVRQLAVLAVAATVLAAIKWAAVDLLQDRLAPGTATAAVFNRYLLTGLCIAGSISLIGWSRRTVLLATAGDEDTFRLFRSTIALIVIVILTLSLSVEISAVVDAAGVRAYIPWHAKHLAWTLLWTAAGVILLLLDRLFFKPDDSAIARLAAVALVAVAGKYILIDTLANAAEHATASVPVLVNLQALAGFVACGGLFVVAYVWPQQTLQRVAQVLIVVTVLLIGSVEIDRLAVLQTAAPAWIVRQAGWSIWWSIFAVALVIAGFVLRLAVLRGFGLALFGLTLLKVVLVDLSGVGSGWRILSFFGLGLLLLGTSVLYGRYGGRLLSGNDIPPHETT